MKYCTRLILLFFFVSTAVSAQQVKVNGHVISSEDNEPIIGASVIVKGTPSIGTATDFDGNFTLNVPAGSKTLIVSYVGMKNIEVSVKERVDVKMEPDDRMLGEVVVTGMTKTDKRLFTGATTRIDAAKAKLDGVADISRSLEGRAAGVSVQNVSGTFGTAPKIRVRGATSIYGNSRPLWVVDGVIMEDNIDISSDDLSSGNAETLISSAIAGINADDIESIQILKDGSATSIYGARAMAGVIVVTTKKGKSGVSRISYTGEFTSRLKPNYRDFNISNSQEQMGIYNEMEKKGWLQFAAIHGAKSSGIYGKMYELINTPKGDTFALVNTPNDKYAFLREHEYLNTDWFGELFSTSLMQNHAVSLSSGTEKAQFYVSLSALTDPGWAESSSVNRYTFNANGSYKISPQLEIKLQGMGARRDQLAPGTLNQETDVVSGEVKRGFDINPYSFALNTSRTMDPNVFYKRNYAPFNIFHELENNYIDLAVTDTKFQGELTWKILKGWDITALGAIRYMESSTEHHVKDFSNMARAYRAGVKESEFGEDEVIRGSNTYLYTNPDDPSALPETILPEGGIYGRATNSMKDMSARVSTSYANEFNNVHLVNLFGGMEIQNTERHETWFRGWGYQYDMGGEPFYDYFVFKQGKEENAEYYKNVTGMISRNLAFFGMGTYSYAGKYVLSGTLRYEGSNKLGKTRQSRWLPTWNVAGAWNAHEESWFENSVVSHATAKVSYSLTADAGPIRYASALPIYKAYTPWRPFASVKEPGLRLERTANIDLTYEKKHELNVGVDIGFLKDRLVLTGDVFQRNQFDLIGQIYTTGVGGGDILKYANVADMSSSGIELGLFTKNIVTKDFTWGTSFLFANVTNKILNLDSNTQMIDLIRGTGFPWQGYPVRALFSIPFTGLNDEGLPVFINEKGETTISDLWFQESNQEKLQFLKYEGPIDPPINGSFENTFSYKGLSLNVFLTYSFGNVVRLDPRFRVGYTDLDAMPREFINRWMTAGDEAYTNIPVIASRRHVGNVEHLSYAYNAYNNSTERVAKGDFIRLKDVSLSYTLPSKWIEKLTLHDASIKVQATNLFLLYADKKLNGQDPEFFNTGGVAVPMPKQFTFTLRLSL